MPRKGKKSVRGEGDLYESPKKRYNVMLTEEAKKIVDAMAKGEGLSTSELLERTIRSLADQEESPKAKPA